MIQTFYLPKADNKFYIHILGAAFLDIAVALSLERFNDKLHVSGLGIAGAIPSMCVVPGHSRLGFYLETLNFPRTQASYYGALY